MVSSTTMTRNKRSKPHHSPEEKITIVRQVIEENKAQSALARESGIGLSTIQGWVKLAREGKLAGYTAPPIDQPPPDLAAEVRRLQRELLSVKQERDFLKKVSAFFAKSNA